MEELEFSYMVGNETGSEFLGLGAFETKNHLRLRRKYLSWGSAWNELLQVALYMKGPDISQIGTTWLGSLIGMQALRPFNSQEIKLLGGPAVFPPYSWLNCLEPEGNQLMAVPWLLDVPIILYRRDSLEEAEIDEKTAFQTSELLYDTLLRLKSNGITGPLALPTTDSRILHNIACWIWGNGGDFRSPDGRRMLIKEPEARVAIEAYYKLHQFLSPEAQHLSEWESLLLYRQGHAAVALSSVGFYFTLRRDNTVDPTIQAKTCVALIPGVPFVGGSNLVIWRHSLHDHAAFDLIRYLIGPTSAGINFEESNSLPARLDVLDTLPIKTDPVYPMIQIALKTGRGISGLYRWGGVEARLIGVLSQLWRDLLANPEMNLKAEIDRRIIDLADKLERTTLASW